MNKFYLYVLLLVCMLGCKPEKETLLTIATFNIRYENSHDGVNSWNNRKPFVYQFVRENKLEIIGLQEVLNSQLRDLKKNLPEYEFIGVGREDGKEAGEYAPIAFLKDNFEKLDGNTFWLSENPDSVGIKGWDAALARIATWVKLKDKNNGKVFMVVNTHFDHIGTEARKQSALLIIDKIKEIVGDNPAIITGDFNITDESDAYQTLTNNPFVLKDAHKIASVVTGESITFHDFGRASENERQKIDFIFVTPQIKVKTSAIPSSRIDSVLYLTDHNTQIATIEF
ncbi:MAG: endonuclease/exonuclease/phosphatase family protein [Bacteroides sp.]|nr:endonuclease/exonuclease/phosphatase family protein [Bacteroides sp.]